MTEPPFFDRLDEIDRIIAEGEADISDLDLLERFTVAAEGQDDDVVLRCTRCGFESVESGNALASNLLVEAREHWRAAHSSAE